MPEVKFDMINRGEKGRNFLGTALFIGLRGLDPLPQRHTTGKSVRPAPLGLPPNGGLPLAGSGMSPFQSLIWGMSIGSAAKHIFWELVTAKEILYSGSAFAISTFNTFTNTLNTLAFQRFCRKPRIFSSWERICGNRTVHHWPLNRDDC